MAEENSTTSHLSHAMATTEEMQTTAGNTSTSWLTSTDRFYAMLPVIIGVIGIAGNALILYAMVVSKQHKKHLLIFNQNVIDLYTCIFLVITYSVKLSNIALTGSRAGYWFCTLIISDTFIWIGNIGSVINLAIITIDRYLKVLSKKQVKNWMLYSAVAFAWIGSIVYNLAAVFSTSAVVNGTCLSYVIFRDKSAKLFYTIWNVLSFYVIILFIFFFCYGRILIAIRRQAKVMASHHAAHSSTITQTQSNQIQTNVIKTMIFVSAFYAIMWFPNYVVMLLYYFSVSMRLAGKGVSEMSYFVSIRMKNLNSINPCCSIIFCFQHLTSSSSFATTCHCCANFCTCAPIRSYMPPSLSQSKRF